MNTGRMLLTGCWVSDVARWEFVHGGGRDCQAAVGGCGGSLCAGTGQLADDDEAGKRGV